MNKQIKKIYDLLYSPIVTPYNLLENAKLDNYSYVNYSKGKDGLIAEMKCNIEYEGEAIFYYHFDIEDKLSKIFMNKNGKTDLVFDRKTELENAKKSYLSSKKNDTIAI